MNRAACGGQVEGDRDGLVHDLRGQDLVGVEHALDPQPVGADHADHGVARLDPLARMAETIHDDALQWRLDLAASHFQGGRVELGVLLVGLQPVDLLLVLRLLDLQLVLAGLELPLDDLAVGERVGRLLVGIRACCTSAWATAKAARA